MIPGRWTTAIPSRQGALKKDQLLPGQQIAVDDFVCSLEGWLFESRGKTKDAHMYSGGALFINMASGHIDCIFQAHLNMHETIHAKEEHEMRCQDVDIMPQEYISDNGSAFTSSQYTAHLCDFKQIHHFAGVGAHHCNVVAERSIQSIMSIAHTMMLHTAIHWPEMADSSLWPMVVQHATYLHNNMPNPTTSLSPNDLFSQMQFDANKFHDLHVWGCLVYVLDKKISDGKKVLRWTPHSHHGVYMGTSLLHSSSVPLVLNPFTGSITPQFHVVFDDWFGSVAVSPDDLPNFNSDEWTKMFGDSSFQFLPDDDDEPSPDTSDTNVSCLFVSRQQAISDAVATTTPPTPLATAPLTTAQFEGAAPSVACSPPTPGPVAPIGDSAIAPVSPAPVQARHQREDTPFSSQPVQQREPTVPSTHQREPPSTKLAVAPTIVPTPSPSIAQPCSTRQHRQDQHLIMDPPNTTYAANVLVTNDDVFECLAMPAYCTLLLQCNLYDLEVCKAAVSDPDTLSFDQILLDPDLDKWKESAAKEIEAL